jgi:hypothetical protein
MFRHSPFLGVLRSCQTLTSHSHRRPLDSATETDRVTTGLTDRRRSDGGDTRGAVLSPESSNC